jgi:protein-arginine kinase activator protein McsA
MICQHCHEREATFHITEITDQADRKTDLCEACCLELRPEVWEPPMQEEGCSSSIVPLEPGGSQRPEEK